MAKYLKIPTRNYKGSQVMDLQNSEEESEIERIQREAGYEPSEIHPLDYVITWMRLPVSDLEGCSYDSAVELGKIDIEFDEQRFSCSILDLKDGRSIGCIWSIEELEQRLIDLGIVDSDIQDQKEFYNL